MFTKSKDIYLIALGSVYFDTKSTVLLNKIAQMSVSNVVATMKENNKNSSGRKWNTTPTSLIKRTKKYATKMQRESHCSDFTSEYASEISMLYTKIQNQLYIHDDIKNVWIFISTHIMLTNIKDN